MECKICERERPLKYFPKRVRTGSGKVYSVCRDCDPEKIDINELAEAVSDKLEVDISCDAYIRRR